MSEQKQAVPSLSGALLRGTVWSVSMRWLSRLLGIIGLAICARILSPSDYGLVNMAVVAIGLSNVLFEFGIDAALIRNQQTTHRHYDTAWSLRVLQNTGLSMVIALSAPLAAHLFKDDRVIPIMLTLAAVSLVGGFQNIYVVDLRKRLEFGRDFLFTFVPRVASFIVTVVGVLVLKTYWGLVLGMCAAELVRLAWSYVLVSERARWSLSEWRELTSFSGWHLLRGFAEFMNYQFDRLLIGILGGPRQVGVFGMARDVATLPATELVEPISRALLPTLSKLNELPDRQSAAITRALAGTMLVAAPLSIGFATIAYEFVLLMFGEQWLDVVPLVPMICVSAMSSGFRGIALNVLVVIGRVRTAALLGWIQTGLCMLAFYPAYKIGGLLGITMAYAAISIVMVGVQGWHLHRLRLLRGRTLWLDISRPLLASAAMYWLIGLMAPMLPQNPVLSAIAKLAIGSASYCTLIGILWLSMGRPDSSERQLVRMLLKRLSRTAPT